MLDPMQNHAFHDDYLGLPVDLSQVLWVVTFNDPAKIDPILLDRMTLIKVGGYSRDDKQRIAREFLIPAIQKNLGVEWAVSDDVLRLCVEHTEEKGVRELKRNLEKVYSRGLRSRLTGEQAEVDAAGALALLKKHDKESDVPPMMYS